MTIGNWFLVFTIACIIGGGLIADNSTPVFDADLHTIPVRIQADLCTEVTP